MVIHVEQNAQFRYWVVNIIIVLVEDLMAICKGYFAIWVMKKMSFIMSLKLDKKQCYSVFFSPVGMEPGDHSVFSGVQSYRVQVQRIHFL